MDKLLRCLSCYLNHALFQLLSMGGRHGESGNYANNVKILLDGRGFRICEESGTCALFNGCQQKTRCFKRPRSCKSLYVFTVWIEDCQIKKCLLGNWIDYHYLPKSRMELYFDTLLKSVLTS